MYTEFFALDELPFEGLPDQRFYYVGSAQHRALSLLTDSLSRSGSICVLSGPSGSGKTTLVRMLMRSLPARMRIVTIDDPRLNAAMLLATILRSCGVVATSFETVAELTLKLRQCLEKAMQAQIVTTVILDEAQGLSDEVIEQVRLISNIEGEAGRMINFLLAGQDDLLRHIRMPQHAMFLGRVRVFAKVPPLSLREMQAYVAFRLQQAGCSRPLFTARALKRLYRASAGLPRLINAVADRALEIAGEQRRPFVSAAMLRRAVRTVRSRGSASEGLLRGLARFIRGCLGLLLPAALGCAIAALGFYVCRDYRDLLTGSAGTAQQAERDAGVRAAEARLHDRLRPGRTPQGRERALFEISKAQSVFAGDSLNTLINLWGYARRDDRPAECADLRGTGLECLRRQGTLADLSQLNRPAVIMLRSDDLTPYAGVLWKLGPRRAQLVLGSRLWEVDRAFVEHEYDGSFICLRQGLPEKAADLGKAARGQLLQVLEQMLGRQKVLPGSAGIDQYLTLLAKRHPDRAAAADAYDLAAGGPRLSAEAE